MRHPFWEPPPPLQTPDVPKLLKWGLIANNASHVPFYIVLWCPCVLKPVWHQYTGCGFCCGWFAFHCRFAMAEEADSGAGVAPAWNMRVLLNTISLWRSDGAEEDDFKTWCRVKMTTRGVDNAGLWYTYQDGHKEKMGWTSTANGFKRAQYNFDRATKDVQLTNALMRDLSDTRAEVRS